MIDALSKYCLAWEQVRLQPRFAMPLKTKLEALRDRALSNGHTVESWLATAKVAESTYYRALNGEHETMLVTTLDRLEAAADTTRAATVVVPAAA